MSRIPSRRSPATLPRPRVSRVLYRALHRVYRHPGKAQSISCHADPLLSETERASRGKNVLGLTTWGAHLREEQSQAPQDQRRSYQKHISVVGWNSGGARRLPTAIPTMITGPWHTILLQECHGILDELRRGELLHVVETGGASDMAIAVRKSTFTHVQPYRYHYNTPSAHSWGCVLTVAKCTLAAPWPSNNSPDDGHHHITFGTMHLHNISAKKPGVAPELLRRVDEAMRTHQVDILHGDFNMASSLGYVSAVFDDPVYIHPNNQDILWGMPKQIGDCCGFVLRRTHWMVDALVSKHGMHVGLQLRTPRSSASALPTPIPSG